MRKVERERVAEEKRVAKVAAAVATTESKRLATKAKLVAKEAKKVRNPPRELRKKKAPPIVIFKEPEVEAPIKITLSSRAIRPPKRR